MQAGQAQPPIINFFQKPVEDRSATLDEENNPGGAAVMVDADWVELIPSGTGNKTKVQYEYKDWIARMKLEARNADQYNPSRFPQEWITAVEVAHKAWIASQVQPVFGTALKNWPALTPAEAKNAEGAGFQTIEQLAESTEEGLRHLGMGGRMLIEKAKAFMLMKNDPTGKFVQQMADLQSKVETMVALQDENAELKKKLELLTPKK